MGSSVREEIAPGQRCHRYQRCLPTPKETRGWQFQTVLRVALKGYPAHGSGAAKRKHRILVAVMILFKKKLQMMGVSSTATILKRYWMDHLIRAHHYLKLTVRSLAYDPFLFWGPGLFSGVKMLGIFFGGGWKSGKIPPFPSISYVC